MNLLLDEFDIFQEVRWILSEHFVFQPGYDFLFGDVRKVNEQQAEEFEVVGWEQFDPFLWSSLGFELRL
jgi:hypothetical protein